MRIAFPLLLLVATGAISLVLEKRRQRTVFYQWVWKARTKIWTGRISIFLGLCFFLSMSLRYPTWLALLNYGVLAFAEFIFYLRSTDAFFTTIAAAYRCFGHNSFHCKVILHFESGLISIAAGLATAVMCSSAGYGAFGATWEFVAALFGMYLVYFVPVIFLFWLSNRALYREAMQNLQRQRREWLDEEMKHPDGT